MCSNKQIAVFQMRKYENVLEMSVYNLYLLADLNDFFLNKGHIKFYVQDQNIKF